MNLAPILRGHRVRLEPLTAAHEAGLRAAAADGELWQLNFCSVPQAEDTAAYIQAAISGRHAFAVTDEATGRIVGTTSFYQPEAAIPRVFIGHTWYARSVWRSRINTACKLLLLQYAFEELGCAAVYWETDILNTRSQAAIERLGARKDGILRRHKPRRDGSIRDTVAYSMIREEWPTAKHRLEQALSRFQAA